jgi:hypothetical protein
MGERTSVLQTAQTPSIPASCYFHRRSDFSTATPVIDNHVVQATVGSCLAHNVCHEMEPFRDCPLWRVKVFHTRIKFWREEDNQWLFISDLKLAGNSLLVRDEKNRCDSIYLNARPLSSIENLVCDGKGKGTSGSPVRPKVPTRKPGANGFVVARKRGNSRGAKGAGHPR